MHTNFSHLMLNLHATLKAVDMQIQSNTDGSRCAYIYKMNMYFTYIYIYIYKYININIHVYIYIWVVTGIHRDNLQRMESHIMCIYIYI